MQAVKSMAGNSGEINKGLMEPVLCLCVYWAWKYHFNALYLLTRPHSDIQAWIFLIKTFDYRPNN